MKSVPRTLIMFGLVCLATPALAQQSVVYMYDQFDPDISVAAGQVAGIPLATQPGFAQGEAFGQLYQPSADQYPVKITGIDVILASPPNMAGTAEVNAQIEIWAHTGSGAAPTGGSPLFSISTADLYDPDTGQTGVPLHGDTANVITFDQSDPANHPPDISSGAFLVMIRYSDASRDLQTEWGTVQCMYYPSLGACGCQEVGVLLDQATTQNANVLHIYSSSDCTGPASLWQFANVLGVTGDFILRVNADVSACTPNCTGKQCGPDGCDDVCGSCGANETCDANGLCICVPQCTGKDCGPDSCGDVCGSCVAPETCDANGQCVSCTPQCDGKDCGPDGCGDVCGSCAADEICDANGLCVPDTGQVSIDNISPDFGYNDSETPVSITGGGFKVGATVRLGGTDLSAVQILSASLISASVPSGMDPGSYMLVVMNSDGGTASLPDAFEVRERGCTPACDGKQCGPDGCGGQCGSCDTGQSCDADGQCVACTPQCQDRQCGPDGCGGQCGSCQAGKICDSDGMCINENKSTGCGCGATPEASFGWLFVLAAALWVSRKRWA
ncbi:MAG TPA: IPT/TIG domain-containing protein [Myxococcota bacterium]|nr:IPT/TIG domain-containing protein [Myxococcota bacterium]